MTGEKRKRGRPRKYPEGSAPKPTTDGPKRGRGRPRKIVPETEAAAAAAAVASSGPKRGRGRPRKEPGMTCTMGRAARKLTTTLCSSRRWDAVNHDNNHPKEGWPWTAT